MRLDRRSRAHYESGSMSQSALKKIAALRRCGGLLSRLAYERGRNEGVDVEGLLRQATSASRNKKQRHSARRTKSNKVRRPVANATSDPLLGFRLAILSICAKLVCCITSLPCRNSAWLFAESGSIQRCCQRKRRFGEIREIFFVCACIIQVSRVTATYTRLSFGCASLVRICREFHWHQFQADTKSVIMHDRKEQARR